MPACGAGFPTASRTPFHSSFPRVRRRPRSQNPRPRSRQGTCRYKDLPARFPGEKSAALGRGLRRAEGGLNLRREGLVSLRKRLLLLLERLDANRESLLVLLELLLERVAVLLPNEQHPDALVDRRLLGDLVQL